jgi:hypothetical protein
MIASPVTISGDPEKTSRESSVEIPEKMEQKTVTNLKQRPLVLSTTVYKREGSPEIPVCCMLHTILYV